MLSKYGKYAVAAAIAGTCGYVSAATLTATVTNKTAPLSIEGNRLNTTYTFPAAADLRFDKALRVGDEIRLTLTGASFQSVAAGSVSLTCTTNNVTLAPNLNSSNSNTVSYGVTGVSAGTSMANQTCSFISLTVIGTSMTSAGDVTISGGVFDAVGNSYDAGTNATAASLVVASVRSQIVSVTVQSAFNGVVDFQNSLGYGFATDDGSNGFAGNSDNLVLAINGRNTANSFGGLMSINFAVSAEDGKSFGFLSSACPTAGELETSGSLGRATSASGATLTINATCTQISAMDTFSMTAGLTVNSTIEVGHTSATPSTGITIEPMTFPSVSVTNVGRGTVTSIANATATGTGSWISNGSTVQIPYMPINTTAGASKIDPVIIISNRSTATGTITAVARDESGNSCTISDSVLGTIAGGRTKSVGGTIRDAVAGSGCATLAGIEKLSITLTVTLPSGSTEVYSGYTVGGGDRVTVVNSSNGRP